MTELLTAAQMRAIEQAAIDSGEVTGLELMERAGRGVVEAIFEEWPELRATSHRAVVLCGPGNNGGDGFVVARLLKEWSWEVEVFLYGDPEKLPPDARVNYERWGELGSVFPISDARVQSNLDPADILVDAGFGTGLTRGIPRELLEAMLSLSSRTGLKGGQVIERGAKVVAVDISSGFCADSGRALASSFSDGVGFFADLTVSFHQAKVGHFLGSLERSNRVSIRDIGLTQSAGVHLINRETLRGQDSNKTRNIGARPLSKSASRQDRQNHKYTHGHAVILSGGVGKTGAARLAARGALRIGAGLVTIGCPQTALAEVAGQITAIMCRPLSGAAALAEMLEDDRLNALCLGPGLGLGADAQQLVLTALAASNPDPGPREQKAGGPGSSQGRAMVLDADALTRFERNPEVLFDALHENVVLTPHAGEFKRLFPDIAEKLTAPATKGPAYSKVDATREAAARAGCTVVFKGPDTVIADRTGRAAINSSTYDRAAPWLASAGSGDVLAGFITGLLARGFGTMQAAETAAWLHTECALSFGPGLIAEDLPEELPKVFRQLEL